jgi:DNA-directed RNA polymerase subunit RPC12/RpoP
VASTKGQTQMQQTLETCPHCGEPLSPWQQVLLSVDRALVCKNCWYRILLGKQEPNIAGESKSSNPPGQE